MLIARCLNIPERSLSLLKVKSKECLEKYSLLASFIMVVSRLNASAQLGLTVVNQCGIS